MKAVRKAKVREIKKSAEYGQTVLMDLGNEYTVLYGQLKDIRVKEGTMVNAGEVIAKVGEENTGRTLVAIAALEQVGLITAADRGGAKFWELVPATGKKNLADAPILKCLEER